MLHLVDFAIWHSQCCSSDRMLFCSYVVEKLQKEFLLVLSFLCLQQQWYNIITMLMSSHVLKCRCRLMHFGAYNQFCFLFTFFGQVLKFLMEKNTSNALHGQVTIGTLILQVLSYCLWVKLFCFILFYIILCSLFCWCRP